MLLIVSIENDFQSFVNTPAGENLLPFYSFLHRRQQLKLKFQISGDIVFALAVLKSKWLCSPGSVATVQPKNAVWYNEKC